MYNIDYQLTHDIDWFFYAEPFIIHAASNQGILPAPIDENANINIQFWVSHLSEINEDNEIVVNYEYINKRLKEVESPYATVESYKRTFVMMARKGLFSFDRDLITPNKYIWVARPKKKANEKDILSYLHKVQPCINNQLDSFSINDKVILLD